MSAWGNGPMDNEGASDLILILAGHTDDPLGYARTVLEEVVNDDPVTALKAEFAISIATVLSALYTGPSQEAEPFYDDERYQAGVLTLVPVAQDREFHRLAVAAIDRILDGPRSHLPEWWKEIDPDSFAEWREGVLEIRQLLAR